MCEVLRGSLVFDGTEPSVQVCFWFECVLGFYVCVKERPASAACATRCFDFYDLLY